MNANLQKLADAPDDHILIVGRDWGDGRACKGVPVDCEGCGTTVSLYSSCKAKLGSNVHGICMRCFEELQASGCEMELGGFINDNNLPAELQ